MDINNNWNAEVAIEREQRLANERETRREEILAQLIEREEEKKKKLEAVEEIIRLEKVYMHLEFNNCKNMIIILKCIYFLFRKNQKLILQLTT